MNYKRGAFKHRSGHKKGKRADYHWRTQYGSRNHTTVLAANRAEADARAVDPLADPRRLRRGQSR